MQPQKKSSHIINPTLKFLLLTMGIIWITVSQNIIGYITLDDTRTLDTFRYSLLRLSKIHKKIVFKITSNEPILDSMRPQKYIMRKNGR